MYLSLISSMGFANCQVSWLLRGCMYVTGWFQGSNYSEIKKVWQLVSSSCIELFCPIPRHRILIPSDLLTMFWYFLGTGAPLRPSEIKVRHSWRWAPRWHITSWQTRLPRSGHGGEERFKVIAGCRDHSNYQPPCLTWLLQQDNI